MELLGVFFLFLLVLCASPLVVIWIVFLIAGIVDKSYKQVRIIGSFVVFGVFGLLLLLFIHALTSDDEIPPQSQSPAVSSQQEATTAASDFQPILKEALASNNVATITTYLDTMDADPNIEIDGDTLLARAAARGEEKIVRAVLAHHPDVNTVGSESGRTALVAAKGHKNIIKLLKAAGATQ